jgi:hypothetical protein
MLRLVRRSLQVLRATTKLQIHDAGGGGHVVLAFCVLHDGVPISCGHSVAH